MSDTHQPTDFDVHLFMQEVRHANRENGHSITGSSKAETQHLVTTDETRLFAVEMALEHPEIMRDDFNAQSLSDTLKKLTKHFEVMAYRNGIGIPDDHRIKVAKTLLDELTENAGAFGQKPDTVRMLTLYQGTDFIQEKENLAFAEIPPWGFVAALRGKSSDPASFLHKALDTTDKLELDEKYQGIGRGTILRVALNTPKDPSQKLDNALEAVESMHADYPDIPDWLLISCAINKPSDPEGELQKKLGDGNYTATKMLKRSSPDHDPLEVE